MFQNAAWGFEPGAWRSRDRGRSLPMLRQRPPKEVCRDRFPPEIETADGTPKRRIRFVEKAVHLGSEPVFDIPIVGFREQLFPAKEPDMAIAKAILSAESKPLPVPVIELFLRAAVEIRDNSSGQGKAVIRAPAFERQGGAGVAEQIRIQGLDEGKKLDTR